MAHIISSDRFERLLTDWRNHEDLKRSGAPLPELWEANRRLAMSRLEFRTVL